MRIIDSPSPNFNDRRFPVDMLVLHYTGMKTGPSALERMCDPKAEVSSHYMVEENGDVFQLVDESMRAWHAGRSSWFGDTDLNSRSVGIEIVNRGHNIPLPGGELQPYFRAQIESVIELSKSILDRHKIPQNRVVGHSDIAPERKDDPGEHFPWEELSERGVGFWPVRPDETAFPSVAPQGEGIKLGETSERVAELQSLLAQIGYAVEADGTYDKFLGIVITAFQRRWNQSSVTGLADPMTVELIRRVAELAGASSR
ncbi:N-acetylmuramoyl-L-alanine amidase [Ponticaulis sp.]|uniref:peptidoglycan recognition protein family protein n=1 Tax=Ponticaulis sp. TaxID=2020902 RepID=UPI000B654BED|nr:N-acetylmuramoyl-L-alanine amidase [Ponticaulis sp.]MAI88958.1 N-acetylmuramoyl-L-alanine amidase [Ponticaulis sp.]OUY01645.1 MAG: hypothetical protein CBB65_00570 [Hyphomonadaceae bacterium TMED5]|tara:strand:+ start:79269 stop:80039 length:771 start_codon:yes stop_codon:yes gene_type:complete